MRILVYAPRANRRQNHFLGSFATLVRDEGHNCIAFIGKTPKKHRSEISRAIGEHNIHILHTPKSTTPQNISDLLARTDTERLRIAIASLAPDVILHLEGKDHTSKLHLRTALAAANLPPSPACNIPTYTVTSRCWGTFTVRDNNGTPLGQTRFTDIARLRTLLRESVLSSHLRAQSTSLPRLENTINTHDTILKSIQADISKSVAAKRNKGKQAANNEDNQPRAAKTPISKTRGEIESIKNYDILHEDTLWLKGWIDGSSGKIASILVNINETEAIKIPLGDTIRGDKATLYCASKIYALETRIPLKPYGSRVRIQINLIDKSGTPHPWKNIFVWLNDSVPDKYTLPILTGVLSLHRHTSTGWTLSGTLNTEGHALSGLRLLSCGEPLAEQKFTTPKVFDKDNVTLDLPSLPAQGRLHLWLDFADGQTTCWRSLENPVQTETSPISHQNSISDGQVIRSPTQDITLANNAGNGIVSAYINGLKVAEANTATGQTTLTLPIPRGNNSLSLELCGKNNSDYSFIQLWNHIENPEESTSRSCVSIHPPLNTPNILRNQNNHKMRKILVIRKAPMPTDEIYIIEPLQRLIRETGARITIQTIDTDSEEMTDTHRRKLLEDGTVVVVSRYIPDRWIQLLTERKAQLGSIVYLMDDDLCTTPDSLWLPGGYRTRMMKVAYGEFQTMLNLCDHFIVACEHLLHRYTSEKTDLVEPAYMHPPEHLDHLARLDTSDEIIIAYHGTQVHRDDIAAISPALKYIHDEYKNVKIQIVMGQHAPGQLKDLPRVEIVPGMPWDDYKAFIAQSRAHIALAPILRTPYNLGKSVIKILDIAGLGAVGLYSRSEPYTKYIRNGETGYLLENDALMWQKALSWLIEHPQEIKRQAHATQTLARQIGDFKHLQTYWSNLLRQP